MFKNDELYIIICVKLNIRIALFDIMKCENCGFENKDTAKFCTKCGAEFSNGPETPPVETSTNNNTKYIIIALVIVILLLVGCIGYFMGTMSTGEVQSSDAAKNSSQNVSSSDDSGSSGESDKAQSTSSSQSASTSSSKSKSWESIGSYSGSGSGSQTITVPEGEIMVKLSAYPIKNYATNHLYVTGSNGQSGGVDWGSHSDVETRSDSFSYTSSSSETFTIDYYETVSWEVEFYRYQ